MQHYTGLEYILIDIANNYGMDKELFPKRIQWAKDTLADPVLLDKAVEEADESLLMIKGINAYYDAVDGVPTNFTMGLDATSSGLQIMACLIGCKVTAANVNLIDTGQREDAYQKVTAVMCDHNCEVERGDIKYPLMTHYYNSKAMPKEQFGEDSPELAAFYTTLMREFPGAERVKNDSQSLWNPEAEFHQWNTPDGHTSRVRVGEYIDSKIEVDELLTHTGNKATFTHRAKIYQPADYGVSLPANIIHSLDGWVVREMRRRAKLQGFDILTVHDQFWCHPNHMNNLRQNYIDIMVWICEHNVLEVIFSTIAGYEIGYTKMSSDLGELVKKAEYPLS